MTTLIEAEEQDILFKLSLVSDARAANYDRTAATRGRKTGRDESKLERPPIKRKIHYGARVPPGFSESDLEASQSPGVSLWAYHTAQLAKAREKGLSARYTALGEAYRDYEIARKRPPGYFGPDSDANRKARDEAILAWKGKRAEWVAVVEGCSDRHVRRLRKKNNLNQTTGEPA